MDVVEMEVEHKGQDISPLFHCAKEEDLCIWISYPLLLVPLAEKWRLIEEAGGNAFVTSR